MQNNENRRVKMTKSMLKDSLLEMLKTKNIHQISIRELCMKADINRSTFYKHYGSQYDLLEDMENDVLKQIEQNMAMETMDISDSSSLTNSLTFLIDNIDLCKMLINSNVNPDFPKRLLYLPSIKAILEKCIPGGENKNEAYYIYDCVVYGGYSMLKRWINDENRESPKEMAEIIIKLFNKLLS